MSVKQIDADMVSPTGTGWVTEASTIGLKPGEWPETISVSRADGSTLYRRSEALSDGELLAYRYVAASGEMLDVLND